MLNNTLQLFDKNNQKRDEINDMTDLNLDIRDFAYNRNKGLVERPELEVNHQPNSSLALLIITVSQGDDQTIIDILKSEVYNLTGEYRPGLVPRRMDEYEILKKGDYTRDYDIERAVWDIE